MAEVIELSDMLRGVKQMAQRSSFRLGSESEVANEFLGHLATACRGAVVSTRHALHQYNRHTGVWEEVDADAAMSLIQHYDGCMVNRADRKTPQPLLISDARLRGIYSCALKNEDVLDKTFFNDRRPGIACTSGFVTVTADGVELTEHSPDNRANTGVRLPYDTDADNGPWLRILRDLFEGDSDAEEKRRALQEFVGASLCGIAPDHARALVLVGGGKNGKSTFMEAVESIFPRGSVTSIAPQLWQKEYYVADLYGKLLNAVGEMPSAAITESSVFKAVVTGDPVVARAPYHPTFRFQPGAGHLFSCNELPSTVDNSSGYWRRFLVISFNRAFKGDRSKQEIVRELHACAPAIFVWALHGAVRLMRNGYTEPASHKTASAEWRRDADQVADFVASCTREADAPLVPVSSLFKEFAVWCERSGRRPMNLRAFGRRLGNLGIDKKHTRDGKKYYIELLGRDLWEDLA